MREFPSDSEILRVFEQQPQKLFRLRELIVSLKLRSSEARELKPALKELTRRGKIQALKKGHFMLARAGAARPAGVEPASRLARRRGEARDRGLVSGRLIAHRDGYGFVVP